MDVQSLGPKFCIPSQSRGRIGDMAAMEALFDQLGNADINMPKYSGALRGALVSAYNP